MNEDQQVELAQTKVGGDSSDEIEQEIARLESVEDDEETDEEIEEEPNFMPFKNGAQLIQQTDDSSELNTTRDIENSMSS